MDLNTVEDIVRRPPEWPGALWRDGDAWLAGGTWLFSEPQPGLRRLIDLPALAWRALEVTDAGLAGAVTIATNMAGRGTDIKLAPEVIRIGRNLVESGMTLEEKCPMAKVCATT